jgi:acetyl esterase/lipase
MNIFKDILVAQIPRPDGTERDLRMNIITSQNPGRPCIIYVFGGGFASGDYTQKTNKSNHWRMVLDICKKNDFAAVSLDYRLSREDIFPAQINDVCAAIRFVKANCSKYGIDPDKIAIWGNSSGAALSALSIFSENPDIQGNIGDDLQQSTDVCCAVLYYGIYDFFLRDKPDKKLTKNSAEVNIKALGNPMEALFGLDKAGVTLNDIIEKDQKISSSDPFYSQYKLCKSASAVEYVHQVSTTFFVCHGSRDPVLSSQQTIRFYNKLVESDCEAVMILNSHGVHGPSLGADVDKAAEEFVISRLTEI